MYLHWYHHLPIQNNKVLCWANNFHAYGDSPKYIAEYLLHNYPEKYDIVWVFENGVAIPEDIPKEVRIVRFFSVEYLKEISTAKVIICNSRTASHYFFDKRNEQIYIQTWHSSLRLKQIEKDAVDTLPPSYVQMAKKDSEQLDMLLAGSKMSKEIFERAFWFDGKIAETGTPQCDILLHADTQAAKRVREYFRIPDGAHIAMYAPTFRKDHDTSVYDLNTDSLLKALRERFGGQWYLLMRLHPHLVHLTDCFHYTDHVLQATDYDDAQELLCATEFLISDYSAIMFDYAVTQRPCMLYTPDLQSYIAQDRDLYFNICELPFASFENQTEMLEAIREFDEKAYQQRLSRFLKKIGSYDDGNACKRVCELIKNGV